MSICTEDDLAFSQRLASVMESCQLLAPAPGAIPARKTGEENADEDNVEVWSMLPHELQENVLARLPLPKLFEVQGLSKEWLFTFQTQRFQDEVSRASRWSVCYCPVHLNRQGLVGYDAASKRWQKVFTLSYLPYVPQGQDVARVCSGAGSLICFARRNKDMEEEIFKRKRGPDERHLLTLDADFRLLLQQFCRSNSVDFGRYEEVSDMYEYIDTLLNWPLSSPLIFGVGAFDIYVTNVVTKQWKQLPSREYMERPHILQLVPVGPSAYKLILMSLLQPRSLAINHCHFCVQIFDSTTNAWTCRRSIAEICSLEIKLFQACRFVFLDPVFYIIVQGLIGNVVGFEVTAYNVEQNSWIKIPQPRAFTTRDFLVCELVLCGTDVMLVTGRDERNIPKFSGPSIFATEYTGGEKLLVYKFSVDTMMFVEISRGPDAAVLKGVPKLDLVTGAGDCIYFGLKSEPKNPIVVFNIRHRSWSSLRSAHAYPCFADYFFNRRWTTFAFQPDLNPYLRLRSEADSVEC